MFPGVFAVVVGVGMLVQWTVSLTARNVPELRSEPIRLGFHLAGEAATAVLLVFSGAGLLASSIWAPVLFYVSVGMLLYTSVVSPGYFAQKGRWSWLALFAALVVLAVLTVLMVASRTL